MTALVNFYFAAWKKVVHHIIGIISFKKRMTTSKIENFEYVFVPLQKIFVIWHQVCIFDHSSWSLGVFCHSQSSTGATCRRKCWLSSCGLSRWKDAKNLLKPNYRWVAPLWEDCWRKHGMGKSVPTTWRSGKASAWIVDQLTFAFWIFRGFECISISVAALFWSRVVWTAFDIALPRWPGNSEQVAVFLRSIADLLVGPPGTSGSHEPLSNV